MVPRLMNLGALVSGLAVLATIASTAYGQTAGAALRSALRQSGEVRVIVALRAASARDAGERRLRVAEAQSRVISALAPDEFQIAHRYRSVSALAGTVTRAGLLKLLANPDVARVDLDTGGSGSLAGSVPQIHADIVQDVRGFDGSGVTVAVLDSGIDSDHPDLSAALDSEQCFCSGGGGCCPGGAAVQSGSGAAEDDHGHGTHVTGIITSDGAVASRGVAPGASVVAIKVLDSNNEFCCASDVVAGLDWILANRPDVKVVNMSLLTFATFSGDCDGTDATTMAFADSIDQLVAGGAAVFAASGNSSLANAMGAPACVANAISVGAVNDFDNVAFFSNGSATLDILAPGVGIVSTAPGGSTMARSGTSMATPHGAGTAALLFEAFPDLTPAALLATLKDTGLPVTDPQNGFTDPRIDAEAAFVALQAPPESFKCYKAKDLKDPKFTPTTVGLDDQFGVNDGVFEVKKPFLVCNPASIGGSGIANAADHLTCYRIHGPKLAKLDRPRVEVRNQLGTVQLTTTKPFVLCVPSSKTVLP